MTKKMETVVGLMRSRLNAVKVTAATAAMLAVPTISAFASEPYEGTNLLTGEVMESVSHGILDLKVTAIAVIVLALGATISVIGISSGSKFAVKKAKGVLDSAS